MSKEKTGEKRKKGALASFSTDECFSSDPWRILEKNATGLPFRFKTAAKAMSEASISSSNGWDSSMATTTDFSISDFTNSNAFLASVLNGNDLDFTSGLIL